jgi:hypothetical protein
MRKARNFEKRKNEHSKNGFDQPDFSEIYSHDFFLGKHNGEIQEHKPWES